MGGLLYIKIESSRRAIQRFLSLPEIKFKQSCLRRFVQVYFPAQSKLF